MIRDSKSEEKKFEKLNKVFTKATTRFRIYFSNYKTKIYIVMDMLLILFEKNNVYIGITMKV